MTNVKVPPFTEAPSTVVGGTATSVFPFDFPFWAAADILVYVDDVLLDAADYSVEGFALQDDVAVEGGYGSGEVTLDTAVANVTVTIDRLVVGDRQTQFSRSVPLGMPALNGDLNRLTARQQDLARLKANAPRGAVAGKYFAWDADGGPIASSGTGADAGLRTDLAATAGSALVKHNGRSVASKLDDVTSIKDANYAGGAVGDGSTDDTVAVQAALDSGRTKIFIPEGVYVIDSVTGEDLYLYGPGTLRKKAATKGRMLDLTGDNRIEGVTLDYDWEMAEQTLPYFNNITIRQYRGSLTLEGVTVTRSFARGVHNEGATLTVNACRFDEGAPNNNLSGGNERVTGYIYAVADALTDLQTISITGSVFVGSEMDAANLHLNPIGITVNASAVDGYRYKAVNITGNTLIACSQNAGAGNVSGAIDLYDGAENVVIAANTIRKFTYSGIKVQNSSRFAITGNMISEGSVPAAANTQQSYGIQTTEKQRSSTAEQMNGTITGNVMENLQYIAISNSCDNVVISGNVIDGVVLATLGVGIDNTGASVVMSGNIGRDIEGRFVGTTGAKCAVIGNTFDSGTATPVSGITFSGAGVNISNNGLLSPGTTTPGIRCDGPASYVVIGGNRLDGFSNGIDLRVTSGAVDRVDIGINQFTNVTTNYNIASGVTNVSRALRRRLPVRVTYDAPSLAVGTAGTVQTTAVPGAALGDFATVTAQITMQGLNVVAWVSAADTVQWYVNNPASNPNGTINLNNTFWNVTACEGV